MLHTLAEVSIAFAGFCGVVGVFGGGSALSEGERTFRVQIMIVASLAAFFGSLLPLALGQFESAIRSGIRRGRFDRAAEAVAHS